MKLLILTQKLDKNDDILGFFHRWVEEFAKHCEFVTVVCLQQGEYDLPGNVKVLTLGKIFGGETLRSSQGGARSLLGKFGGKIKTKIGYVLKFWKYIWQERKNYDAVFVHMNVEYLVFGGLFFKLWKKKISLWYTHKKVNWKLRVAEFFADTIFTASKESFRLPSKKVRVVGHGIDITKFQITNYSPRQAGQELQIREKTEEGKKEQEQKNKKFKIITVGRISQSKNLDLLIEAAGILKNKGMNFIVNIAGAPLHGLDDIYFDKIKKLVKERGVENLVGFVGSVPYVKIHEFYGEGDLFVNFSDTGSIDKAVLEAMVSGLLVLTSNEAFKNILSEKYFVEKNAGQIADKIIALASAGRDESLREYVVKNHNLENLIGKMVKLMGKRR